MPVRDFNSGIIRTSLGSCDVTGDWTIACIVKMDSSDNQWIWSRAGESDNGAVNWTSFALASGNGVRFYPEAATTSYTLPLDEWLLICGVRPEGSTDCTFYVYNFETKEFLLETTNSLSTAPKHTGTPAEIEIGRWNTTEKFTGALAALGIFSGTFSKEDVEGLIGVSSLSQWAERDALGLWLFNQNSVDEEVKDLTGNGADEVSREGTEVVEEEPPIPYDEEEPAEWDSIPDALAEMSISDDLDRDEDPLAGIWKILFNAPAIRKIGKCVAGSGWSVASGEEGGNWLRDGAFYDDEALVIAGDTYAFALFRWKFLESTVTGNPKSEVWLLMPDPENKESGFRVMAERITTSTDKLKISLWRVDEDGTSKSLGSIETEEYGEESRIAIVAGAGKLYLFASKEATSAFELLLEAEDSTFTEGYSGLAGSGEGMFTHLDFATGTFLLAEPAPEVKVKVQTPDGIVEAVRWVKQPDGSLVSK